MKVTERCGQCHAEVMVEDPYDAESLGFAIAAFRLHHLHESEAERAAREKREAKQEEAKPKGELGFHKNEPERHNCGNPQCPLEGMTELEVSNFMRDLKLNVIATEANKK